MKLKINKLELNRVRDMQPYKIHYYLMLSHCLAIKFELIISLSDGLHASLSL